MKFGQNFHQHLVPEWEPFYVNYDLLKKLIKAGLDSSPCDFTELYTCLSDSARACHAFHEQKYAILHKREADICKRYGLKPYSSEFNGLLGVDHSELKGLLEAFLELRADLVKLQRYNSVNYDATARIYAKLAPFQDETHRTCRLEWIRLQNDWKKQCLLNLGRLHKLIPNVRFAHIQQSTESSLYLQNLHDPKSPASLDPREVYDTLRYDRPSALARLLEDSTQENRVSHPDLGILIKGVLKFSITCHSTKCVDYLVSEKLPNAGISVDHICLNHLITVTGQSKTSLVVDGVDGLDNPRMSVESSSKPGLVEAATSLFIRLLEQLGADKSESLQAKDPFGRLPLHYGARYGLAGVCHSILKSLQDLDQNSSPRDAILAVDSEGHSPLQYALIYNHKAVVRLFLDSLEIDYQGDDEARNHETRKTLSDLLTVSIRYQHDEVARHLMSSYIDISHQYTRGQTALYVAAQIGREDYVKALLDMPDGSDATEISETVHNWTPLFIACANGHLEIVKLLLQVGANQMKLDDQGWTAKEHAAFKGHLTVAGMLNECETRDYPSVSVNPSFQASWETRDGFRTDESILVVNLGGMRKGNKKETAVSLNYIPPENTLGFQPGVREDTELLLEVSVPGAVELVQIPILDDMVYEPFIFPIDNPSEAMLLFKVFYASHSFGAKGEPVGRGIAMVKDLSHGFGEKRESLIRDRTVPLIDHALGDFIGSVRFTFVMVEPYRHVFTPSPPVKNPLEADQVQLVGHRGLGQNNASHKHLQLGENTVMSFVSAVNQGASIVEFDVQLTKNLVPVIYHDFSLSESGTDIPIHDLSLEQFMYASHIQSPRGDPASVLGDATKETGKPRSRSLTRDQERGTEEVRDRMKHTIDFSTKGFKPNTRGDFIQDSFTTLEELLIELPKSLCLNIEIKYPRLHEAVDAGVAPVGIEINTFVDTILDKIYRSGAGRPIILSSFTPEICILLSVKQQVYPVMLITNAGKVPVIDKEMRGGSLQVAIRFAKQWDLAGLVLASETFVLCPRLIRYVKKRGLKCASYGPLNDVPENVKIQVNAGIDILMADRVGLVAKTLKEVAAT